MKGGNGAAHKGTQEMEKGQIVKCVESHDSSNITVGKEYVITSGKGDERESFAGFTDSIDDDVRAMITDDDGDSITIIIPECHFGKWEVVS